MNEKDLLQLLKTLSIEYTRVDHPALSSVEDYYKMNIELPDQGVKNLFLRNKKGNRYYLVVMDEHIPANLPYIAEQINETRLSFGSPERLKEMLGLLPGCVTPLALPNDMAEHKLTVLLDQNIKQDELVGFHPLVNNSTLCITYDKFMRFLDYTGHKPQLIKVNNESN